MERLRSQMSASSEAVEPAAGERDDDASTDDVAPRPEPSESPPRLFPSTLLAAKPDSARWRVMRRR